MSDTQDLLAILNAHGQSFIQHFDLPVPGPSKKRKHEEEAEASESDEEEWHGITHDEGSEEEEDGETNEEDSDMYDEDGDFVADSSTVAAPNVVVFSDTSGVRTSAYDPSTKASMKSFMSSRVSKIANEGQSTEFLKSLTSAEEEEEKTNTQNDALLHKLLHTKLLSGSLDTELELTSAQRKKALAGRVAELAGGARLGKGEKFVRKAERNQNSKSVRMGLASKEKQRSEARLDEAKNMGNYHRSLKKVYEDPDDAKKSKRGRERGIGMGVGRFSGGILKLSREDISKVNDSGRGGRGGRGGGRGRGRGGSNKRGKR
ncbi:hypothetical protein CYLTODRAFT_416708 [Cylindrobasidium torrendii FP15055 ss-10]|uniref:Protein FAF1 n=1 Tax=Cylindrobasidium torrendii FP15055 ss-10 TaxID=1314674 RepID=A0A0D7BTG1_9AGAR|nr:hypothetical protein CYLTODRAFT_416708 [Cylindrobasidium torrendii FP15055 ss-10]